MPRSSALEPFLQRVPTFGELNWPALQSLVALGGSASIAEHYEDVVERFNVSDVVLDQPHKDSGRTELEYRLAWARSWLKKCGLVENSARGVWSVTEPGEKATREDVDSAISASRSGEIRKQSHKVFSNLKTMSVSDEQADWRDLLLGALHNLQPNGFERLSQRVLRESGFVKVEVTGRSGDGGIDGTGIMQLSLLSFHVLFQCKKYRGAVGAGAVRDFRGAMMGRTDKGLIITTGHFTSDARREATRDGAPPIDLIDGTSLCEKLKELNLGVSTKLVEEVSIDIAWFEQI